MKFCKKTGKVVYVDSQDVYRVTLSTVTAPTRPPLSSKKNLVGVATAVDFWDKVDKRAHCLGCARSVREAWLAGDRYLLDTEEARSSAELVADIASTKPDTIDICSALVDLLNAIAKVKLSNTTMDDYEVLPFCEDAIKKCFSCEGYESWNVHSKRCKFLYSLPKVHRTDVVFTLIGLYLNYGSTPILTSRQRQELISLDRGEGVEGAVRFFDDCLRQISSYRFS